MVELHPFLAKHALNNSTEKPVGILSDVDGTLCGGPNDCGLQRFLSDLFNFNAAAKAVLEQDVAQVLIYSGNKPDHEIREDIVLFNILRRAAEDLGQGWIFAKRVPIDFYRKQNIQLTFEDDSNLLTVCSMANKATGASYGVHPADAEAFLQDWASYSSQEKAEQLAVWLGLSAKFDSKQVQAVIEQAAPRLDV